MLQATNELWRYTGEFFITVDYEKEMNIDVADLKIEWMKTVRAIFEEATLPIPDNTFMQTGGKKGIHTENLGFILAEMQYLQRTFPGANW